MYIFCFFRFWAGFLNINYIFFKCFFFQVLSLVLRWRVPTLWSCGRLSLEISTTQLSASSTNSSVPVRHGGHGEEETLSQYMLLKWALHKPWDKQLHLVDFLRHYVTQLCDECEQTVWLSSGCVCRVQNILQLVQRDSSRCATTTPTSCL